MTRVGEFQKVSYERFYADMKAEYCWMDDGYIQDCYDLLKLPTRATKGSAGYDFKAPFTFELQPGQTIKIPTGIRCKIGEGWWLGCFPRSSLGFKYRMQLANTVGVIDHDYFYSDNEGHIFVKLTNDSKECKAFTVHMGDGFIQGIFIPFGITYSDDADGVRNGGMGSTGA